METDDEFYFGDALVQGLARNLADARVQLSQLRSAAQWALRYLDEGDYELAQIRLARVVRETTPR